MTANIKGVPKNTWTYFIEPSNFDKNVAFVVFDGHTQNDMKRYFLKTTDAGNSWTMNSLLPSTTYYGLKVFNENKILVGGSTSSSANIRITTDAGSTWNTFAAGTGTVYSFAFFDSHAL